MNAVAAMVCVTSTHQKLQIAFKLCKWTKVDNVIHGLLWLTQQRSDPTCISGKTCLDVTER